MPYANKVQLEKNVEINHWLTLPLDSDPYKSRALWQGATYAVHPVTKVGYIFQMQAQETPKKRDDVEQIWVHVFECIKTGLKYKFSTLILKGGHVQSLHVRISVHGRMWAWMGTEYYDGRGKVMGTRCHRILLRRGRINLKSSNVQRIITGPGSVQVVGNFDGMGPNPADWTIVLRRPESETEVYEWHSEDVLRKWRDGKNRPKPYASMRVLREGGTYQSSCALGTYKTAAKTAELYRINGSTGARTTVRKFQINGGIRKILGRLKLTGLQRTKLWDITNYAPTNALPISSEEGEAVFVGPGRKLVAGKRANSTARRKVFYGRITGSRPVA